MNEEDIRTAANTDIQNIFSELRDQAGVLKTSTIIVGSLLSKVKETKAYKEAGSGSFNAYVNSIGLSVEMAMALMQTSEVLESRFPDAYRNLKEGVEDAYLPGRKAMAIASKLDPEEITSDVRDEFTRPTGVAKLKRHSEPTERVEESEGLPIDKLAKSSKIFTKKVLNCEDLPEAAKSDMASLNQRIQEINQNTDNQE